MTTKVTKENYETDILKSNLPVVIDANADWCGPCQQMKPLFEELAKELSEKYKFGILNIDENRELAVSLNVSSIPTFIFIKNGQVTGKETGYMSKDILKEKIEGHLD